MDMKKPTFFDDYPRVVSLHTIIEAAELLFANFGSYFFFGWNCQDAAAWFLTFHGIPLKNIDPSGFDIVIGSGSSQG